jgi:hypothetical protein
MEKLTIKAASQESAQQFCAALADFQCDIEDSETGPLVTVTLDGTKREMLAVLRALEECVSQRAEGAAVVELGDQTYTLHATDRPEPEASGSSLPAA